MTYKTARRAGSCTTSETRLTSADLKTASQVELPVGSSRVSRVSDTRALSADFHRRRAEREMEMALRAGRSSIAIRHLELARLHRERRNSLFAGKIGKGRLMRRSCGTDKEA